MEDITKTGPVGLKGLKGLSQKVDKEAEVDKFINQQKIEKKVDDFIAMQRKLDTPEKVASAFEADAVSDYGNNLMEIGYKSSMYDKEATEANLSDLNEFRAQKQPWYSQLASGVGKGVVLAGTTFLDGTVGLLFGLGTGVSRASDSDSFLEGTKNFFSSLFDNDISNSINEINKAMEDILPNYRTNEELNSNLWEKLGTMNFWADSFIKNIGFTVGAAYSGKAWLSALKALNVVKGSLGAKAVGSIISAVNEGRVEANHAMHDSFELAKKQIEDANKKRRHEILNSSLSEEDKILLLEDLNNNTNKLLEDAKNRADIIGTSVLIGNTALLSLDNLWTFGHLYAKGFSEAKNLAKNTGKKTSLSDVMEQTSKELQNEVSERVAKEGSKYNWRDITNKEAIRKGITTGMLEGNEELAQQAIANTFSYMHSPDNPDAYYKAMIDPKANIKAKDTYDSIIQGLATSYGDGSQWEQFAVGFLTGIVGTPTFGKTSNSDASTYIGKGKFIGLSGGLFGELSMAKDQNIKGRQSVDTMNKFVETLQNGKRRFARSTAFTDAMDGFAANDNRNEYQNYADNDFFSAISSFISTGREQDLMDMIDQDFENMSDEELLTIASSFSKNPNKQDSKEGGWRNIDGTFNPLTNEGRKKMREELIEKRDKIKEQIKSYKDSLLKVRAISNNSLKKDEEEELAWYHWKSKRAVDRIKEIKERNKGKYSVLYEELSIFRNHLNNIIENSDVVPEHIIEALEYTKQKDKIKKDKENLTKTVKYIEDVLYLLKTIQEAKVSKLGALSLGNLYSKNRAFIEDLKNNKKLYDLVLSQLMDYSDYNRALGDLQDIIKLHDTRKIFIDRFNEFTENPTKLQKNREKLEKEQEKVDKEINKIKSRNNAHKATRTQIINNEVDTKAAKDSLTDSDADKAQKALIEDAEKSKKVADKAQNAINKMQSEASDSESEAIEAAAEVVEAALAKSESFSELADPSSSIYMTDKDGNPVSDETIAIVQNAITKALNELEESEGFDESTMEKVEKQIDKQKESSTGHDATDKISAINEAESKQSGEVDEEVEKKVEIINSKEKELNEENVNDTVDKINNYEGESKPDKNALKPGKNSSKKGRKIDKRKPTTLKDKKKKSDKNKDTNVGKNSNSNKSLIENSELTKVVDSYISKLRKGAEKSEVSDSTMALINSSLFEQVLYSLAELINAKVSNMQLDSSEDIIKVLQESDEYKNLEEIVGYVAAPMFMIDLLEELKNSSIQNKEKIDEILGKEGYKKERESTTTVTSNIENTTSSDYTPEKENIISPFRRATSEVTFGNLKSNKPYYTTLPKGELREKLEALYNFLKSNGVFTRQANVKKGDTIYFTTSQELNDKMGEVVILMSTDPEGKNIVGDLPRKGDKSFENNEYLKNFYNRFISSLDNWKKDNTEGNFVFNETSTVNQTMYGSPLFTDSSSKESDRTLNEIFKGNSSTSILPFKIGILIDGTVKTSNQGARDETTEEEDRIIKPKKDFANGTPFVLVLTGNGTNRLIAVPFHMSKYNESMNSTKFSQFVQYRIKNIIFKYKDNLDDYQLIDLLLKSTLEDLFVDEFHVNYNKETGVLDVHIGSQKDNNYVSVYKNTIDNNSLKSINSSLLKNDLEIRVNRRLINSTVNINGTDVKYNEIIGELAHNNLDRINTIGDYFTVYPLDDNGDVVKVKTEKIKDGRFNSTIPAIKSSVKYKGKTYNITASNKITDSDNKEVNLDDTERNIIMAKSIVIDSPNYLIAGDSYWHILPDGTLFYNKDGEERIVSDSKEIKEIKDNLNNAISEDLTTDIKEETPSQKEVKLEYPKNFKTTNLKKAFDMLGNKYKEMLLNEKLSNLEKVKSSINRVLKNANNKIERVTKEALEKAINDVLTPKYRLNSNNEDYEQIDIDKELKWLNKVLPNISKEAALNIVKGLIKVSNSKNPEVAWGMLKNGIITLSELAASGTLYHEAFHYVVDTFLNPNDLDTMFNEGSKKYGITREDRYSDLEIEENLAEEFRKYVQAEESLIKGTLTKIYRSLKHTVQSIIGNEPYIDNLFYRINRGKFKKSTSINNKTSTKYKEVEYTTEMLNILNSAPRDSEGNLLAPNGKKSNLTERQYAQVRTKAFKDWFGDWENDPENASKVVDENGEPLVVYHSGNYGITTFRQEESIDIEKGEEWVTNKGLTEYENEGYVITEEDRESYKKGKTITIKRPNNPYFTNNKRVSESYIEYKGPEAEEERILAGETYPVFLNIRDAALIEGKEESWNNIPFENSKVSTRELERKFRNTKDGVIIKDIYDLGASGYFKHKDNLANVYIVYSSNNIKSATDNIGTFSKDNNDIRYRKVSDNEQIFRQEAQRFLNNFGITIREIDEFEDGDLFDALNRTINIRNVNDISEGVGYAIAFMMQHNNTMTELMKYKILEGSSVGIKNIRRELRKHKNYENKFRTKDLDAETRQKFLKDIGKDIASELRKLYNIESYDSKPTPFLTKLWNVIEEFFNMLTPYNKSMFRVIRNYTRNIANSLKLNDASIILETDSKPGTTEEAFRVDIEKALEENPYERDIAKYFTSKNIALAGSASIAISGTLYRPLENPLHDLDFSAGNISIEELNKIINDKFPFNEFIREINNDEGGSTETYLVLDRPFKTRKPISDISGYEIYDPNTGEKLGSYVGSELYLESGVKGKFLDFFIDPKPKYPNTVYNIKGTPYLISDYRNAFSAKIKWARPKDIWDYNRFILNGTDKEEYEESNKEKLKTAKIIWGHPAIGKTTYLERHNDIIEWDDEVNPRRWVFIRDQIDPEHKMDTDSEDFKNLQKDYMANWKEHPEYVKFLTDEWEKLKDKARRENKKLFASPLPLLEIGKNDFDLFINVPEKVFLKRNTDRGGRLITSMDWKYNINENLTKVDPDKIIFTDKYFSDLMEEISNKDYNTVSKEYNNYRASKVDYNNLNNNQLNLLKEVGISEDEYNLLTVSEKENLLKCIY